jgi:hypothetical protein
MEKKFSDFNSQLQENKTLIIDHISISKVEIFDML